MSVLRVQCLMLSPESKKTKQRQVGIIRRRIQMKRNVLCCKWCAEWNVTYVHLHGKFNQILCLPWGRYSLENKNLLLSHVISIQWFIFPVKLSTEVICYISLEFQHTFFFWGGVSLSSSLTNECFVVKYGNRWILKECKAVDLHCFTTWAKERNMQ